MNRLIPLTAAVLGPILALAACNRSPDDATSISINADGGNVLGAVDARSGEVKLDVPGFSGKISLPRIKLDASNFDLNGVHLYPGSTIDNVEIAGGGDNGTVRIAFTSPATPDTLRTWFADRLNKAGFTVTPDAQGLKGTTDEKKPFAMTLSSQSGDRSKGTITLGS